MRIYLKSFIFFIGFIIFISNSSANPLPYCSSTSIWKHAAYKGNNNKTYFENINSAIAEGYCGIEIDIIYDEKEKLIYISHNPISSSDKKKELSLKQLDNIINNKNIYLWLDWKNTNLFELKKGFQIIQESMNSYLSDKDSIIFIETPNILHNKTIMILNDSKNIAVLNWLSYSSKKKIFIEKIKNIYRKVRAWSYVCFLKDKWVSSHDLDILKLCKEKRKTKGIFIFTINDNFEAQKAFDDGALVVLSDDLK